MNAEQLPRGSIGHACVTVAVFLAISAVVCQAIYLHHCGQSLSIRSHALAERGEAQGSAIANADRILAEGSVYVYCGIALAVVSLLLSVAGRTLTGTWSLLPFVLVAGYVLLSFVMV